MNAFNLTSPPPQKIFEFRAEIRSCLNQIKMMLDQFLFSQHYGALQRLVWSPTLLLKGIVCILARQKKRIVLFSSDMIAKIVGLYVQMGALGRMTLLLRLITPGCENKLVSGLTELLVHITGYYRSCGKFLKPK